MSQSYTTPAPQQAQQSETPGAGPAVGGGNQDRIDAMKKQRGGTKYTIRPGDTLWRIAQDTYGNGSNWMDIRDSNPTRVQQGGNLILAGDIIDLPLLDVATPAPGAATPIVSPATGGVASATEPELRTTGFGVFRIYPDAFVGPLPPTVDGFQVVRKAHFLELETKAALEPKNLTIDALDEGVCYTKPQLVTIGTEQVLVSSKAEAQHAVILIREMDELYGVKVNSQAGVDAIKQQYASVPQTELDKLKTKEWEYKELEALSRALERFAPILGANRKDSNRSADNQEITTVSKVDQAIDKNSATGVLDTTTLGEYFKGSKNFSMFSAGTNSAVDFKDSNKQLEGTAIHEIAHGLMKTNEAAFIAATPFWTDRSTKSGVVGAEEPVTAYGKKNAGEDLSEAVMFYFVENATLKSKCPQRTTFIDGVVAAWKPKAP